MQPFTLEEFKECAKESSRIAVFKEIPAGNLTPIIIYRLLNQSYEKAGVILEDLSQRDSHHYAYICFEPITSLSIPHGAAINPLNELRTIKSKLQYATRHEVAHLITKAVGFITYDAACSFENITSHHNNENSLPLCLFHFYALSITFDYKNKTILISTITDVATPAAASYHEAQQKIQNIITLLTAPASATTESPPKRQTASSIEVDISDLDFMQMVTKAKEYIIQGEAFQIVISRCFKRRYSVSALEIYKILCETSPAPFMFYLPLQSQTIIGASPERLIRVLNHEITANPIAGTRKRVDDKSRDTISADLLNDKKELAEHMMLVDLARNDVGAVSKPGSVQVTELLKVKHYPNISHITSTVVGQLQEKYDALDALKAAIPAGTLSGAPKIRAMQIINELEPTPRGLYGGGVCRFDLHDNFDSCIAIRMAVLQNGIATIRTGAGIVYASDPYKEAEETYQKAYTLLDAIARAHGEEMI